MASSNHTLSDLPKLESLDGSNYKRWSQKLLIFFEQLEIDYVLFEDAPLSTPSVAALTADGVDVTPPPPPEPKSDAVKYEKDNKAVRGHLLYHMSNSMFDLFVDLRSAKEIWEVLQSKYGGDDARLKKYVVGKVAEHVQNIALYLYRKA